MQAVKNAFRFIRWQWNQFEFIPKMTLTSLFMTLMSIVTMKFETVSDAFMIASIILLIGTFAAFIRMIVKDQYAKFKAERNGLFDTIKHSENIGGDGGKN